MTTSRTIEPGRGSADKRSEATYKDADAVLHEAVKIQEHLAVQDGVLNTLVEKLQAQHG